MQLLSLIRAAAKGSNCETHFDERWVLLLYGGQQDLIYHMSDGLIVFASACFF